MRSKAETFIGFCMRAGKYKIGTNACYTLRRANLIIICSSASENAVKEGLSLSKRFNCPIIKTTENLLSYYTHKDNGKIMAITDKQFAKLILESKEKEFIEIE
ncbi:MAG: hypothetical protein KBS91_01660 [Firmicutes bacterium]|nr:hypothetical protein [Candidatus Caballimonas caccae]